MKLIMTIAIFIQILSWSFKKACLSVWSWFWRLQYLHKPCVDRLRRVVGLCEADYDDRKIQTNPGCWCRRERPSLLHIHPRQGGRASTGPGNHRLWFWRNKASAVKIWQPLDWLWRVFEEQSGLVFYWDVILLDIWIMVLEVQRFCCQNLVLSSW